MAGELGDSLGALGDGVLGELPGEDETDGGLDLAGTESVPLVVEDELAGLGSDALEDVVGERVHDAHGLRADAGVFVNLLEDLVDVGGVRLFPPGLALLGSTVLLETSDLRSLDSLLGSLVGLRGPSGLGSGRSLRHVGSVGRLGDVGSDVGGGGLGSGVRSSGLGSGVRSSGFGRTHVGTGGRCRSGLVGLVSLGVVGFDRSHLEKIGELRMREMWSRQQFKIE